MDSGKMDNSLQAGKQMAYLNMKDNLMEKATQ